MGNNKQAGKDIWYKFGRFCLEWLHPRQDYTPESCEQWLINVVERAKSLNINVLLFDLYHGGSAVFNGSVAPKDRHVGDVDLYAILDRELHKRGMKFVLMHMATHCNSFQAEEYPQWLQRNADGATRPGLPAPVPCLNTPWVHYFMQELRSALSRYQIDGIYIEGLVEGVCYCDFCQTEFQKRYGYELPKDPNALNANREVKQFNLDIVTNYVRLVRQVIDEVSPSTVWIPCPSAHDVAGLYTDYANWGKYADAVELERQWGGGGRWEIPLRDIGMSMRLISAESGKPAMGTLFLAWSVDCDYSHCTAPHYRLNFTEILANGATPQLHAQTVFDLDQSEMGTVKEMYDFEEKVRPFMLEAEPIPYAALVFERADVPGEWFKGYYRALVEAHIPFRVIPKSRLVGDLFPHKVLLLPNIVNLSDAEIEAIENFVANGGGLVMTYRTGFGNADGSLRQEPPLLALAGGRDSFGITTFPPSNISPEFSLINGELKNYMRVTEESPIAAKWAGRLQSFKGSYIKIEPVEGTVIVKGLDYDYSKSFHRHHPIMGWYPGEFHFPLVVTNQPAGKIVYFAGEMDAAALRQGMPGQMELLTGAAVWAAGEEPPIKMNTPFMIELAGYYSPTEKAYILFFVNQTMNQMERDWIVRYVQPLSYIRVDVQVGNTQVKEVAALTGAAVEWRQESGVVRVELSVLKEYEAVVIKL